MMESIADVCTRGQKKNSKLRNSDTLMQAACVDQISTRDVTVRTSP